MSFKQHYVEHYAGDTCPACSKGTLRLVKSKFETVNNKSEIFTRFFLGCTSYPDCKYTIRSANGDKTSIKPKVL